MLVSQLYYFQECVRAPFNFLCRPSGSLACDTLYSSCSHLAGSVSVGQSRGGQWVRWVRLLTAFPCSSSRASAGCSLAGPPPPHPPCNAVASALHVASMYAMQRFCPHLRGLHPNTCLTIRYSHRDMQKQHTGKAKTVTHAPSLCWKVL